MNGNRKLGVIKNQLLYCKIFCFFFSPFPSSRNEEIIIDRMRISGVRTFLKDKQNEGDKEIIIRANRKLLHGICEGCARSSE